jgi:Bacterial protein of unknown function (DUF882)
MASAIWDHQPSRGSMFSTIPARHGGSHSRSVRLVTETHPINQCRRLPHTGVAQHSLHMQAEAIDIRLHGIPTSELRDAALRLHRGGVGYYRSSDSCTSMLGECAIGSCSNSARVVIVGATPPSCSSGSARRDGCHPHKDGCLRQVDLASARESLCRGLGSRWFTERLHSDAFVAYFQHGQLFRTARQLKDYAVTRCRLHQRTPQR